MSIDQALPYIPRVVPVEALPYVECDTPPSESPHIQIYSSTDPKVGDQVKWAAQQLQADVYLENGYITEENINPFGLYSDEYTDRSTHFFVANGRKVAAARQINATRSEGIASLPTAKNFHVDPDRVAQAAKVRSVADLKPREVVEISALASRRKEGGTMGNLDAVKTLYSQLLRNSLEKGQKLWLLNVDPLFLRVLGRLVGEEQVHVLGEKSQYMGPPTVPVAINPQEVVRKILSSDHPNDVAHKEHLRAVFEGVNDRRIPRDIRKLMADNQINAKRFSDTARLVSSPKFLAQVAIMGYSAARAFPAATVDEFHGDVATLWGIDIATSIPYAYGLTEMYVGKSVGRKVLGATIAIPTFLAPYAYFYAEGESYPTSVNAIIAALVGTALGKEFISRRLRARREERLSRVLLSSPGREIAHHSA